MIESQTEEVRLKTSIEVLDAAYDSEGRHILLDGHGHEIESDGKPVWLHFTLDDIDSAANSRGDLFGSNLTLADFLVRAKE